MIAQPKKNRSELYREITEATRGRDQTKLYALMLKLFRCRQFDRLDLVQLETLLSEIPVAIEKGFL